jgi:LPXTG-motif cell wall-anchored protein
MLEEIWHDINMAITTGEITNTVWVIIVILVLIVLFGLLFRLKGLLVLNHFRRRGLDWRRRWRWRQT